MAGVIILLSLSSCEGIFESIYDDPEKEDKEEFGFIHTDTDSNRGTIYINASDYKEWHYIDFDSRTVQTIAIDSVSTVPEKWDFAIHRYDTKTNQGEVKETKFLHLNDCENKFVEDEQEYTRDIWTTEQIMTDLSQMIDSIIQYTEDYYNPVLSRWIDVDRSTMPPIYTLSNRVYVLRTADQRRMALKFIDFMNYVGDKGFITIDYIYPF